MPYVDIDRLGIELQGAPDSVPKIPHEPQLYGSKMQKDLLSTAEAGQLKLVITKPPPQMQQAEAHVIPSPIVFNARHPDKSGCVALNPASTSCIVTNGKIVAAFNKVNIQGDSAQNLQIYKCLTSFDDDKYKVSCIYQLSQVDLFPVSFQKT